MPLSKNKPLIDSFKKRRNSWMEFSDDELKELLSNAAFTATGGVFNPKKGITDTNHNASDVMRDFVLNVGPLLHPLELHELTARLIKLSPESVEKNVFMRGPSLAKVFLAYEMFEAQVKTKSRVEEHFQSPRMQKELSTEKEITNFKNVILKPIIESFKREDHYAKSQVDKLIVVCSAYKDHLEKTVSSPDITQMDKDSVKLLNTDHLGQKKLVIVENMLAELKKSDTSNLMRLAACNNWLTNDNTNILKDRRDSSLGAKFLETVLNIITLGVYSKATKGSFAFWKSHGEVLGDTVQEELNKAKPTDLHDLTAEDIAKLVPKS